MNTRTVGLSEQQRVVIAADRVLIQDVRYYSPKLITVMTMEDAILFAKTVMAFLEEPDNADEWAVKQEELRREATWDAISERA